MRDKWLKRPLHMMTAIMALAILVASTAQAEPPQKALAADIVGTFIDGVASGLGSLSGSSPTQILATCSAELGECWKAHGLNKDNQEQVQDICWKEIKKCPKVCKEQYFSLRKAGVKSTEADDEVLFGTPSCVPTLDESINPEKLTPNNSTLRLTVTLAGQAVKANIELIALDAQGKERPATMTYNPGYINTYLPNPSDLISPLAMSVHAGKYHFRVFSSNAYPDPKIYSFSTPTETVSIEDGQTLNKAVEIAGGRLKVSSRAQDKYGKPVTTRLEIRRSGEAPNYHGYPTPLDMLMPVDKYQLIATESGEDGKRITKTFDIEIEAGKLATQSLF